MADPQGTDSRRPGDFQAIAAAGGVLYCDCLRAPPTYHLSFLLPLSLVLVTGAFAAIQTGREALIPLGMATLLLAVLWALFGTLRVCVSSQQVTVQFARVGPTIALRDIEKVEPVESVPETSGGWGIRRGWDAGLPCDIFGDGARRVRIVYKQGDALRVLHVASREPERLAEVIRQVCAVAVPPCDAPPVAAGASPESRRADAG